VNVRPQPPVPHGDQSEAYNQLAQRAERIRQRYSKLTKEQAFDQAIKDHPQLYAEHAAAKNENVSHLVRVLVENVYFDDLFSAVAGDAKAKPAKRQGWQAGKSRSLPVPRGNAYAVPLPGPKLPAMPAVVPLAFAFAPMLEGRLNG
jgi:hypothetical protein